VVAARTTLPARGVLLPPVLELYITIALAGLAGTGLGLCLSAVATTPDKATSLIPIVLVPQVVFAGIMFALHGPTEVLSMAVAARAAVDALSATIDTNALSTPMNLIPAEPRYAPVAATVLAAWGALVAQMVAFTALAWWALRRRA
jgi:ABC transport system ATP-binding/permease protein